jgi:hypothetical protein
MGTWIRIVLCQALIVSVAGAAEKIVDKSKGRCCRVDGTSDVIFIGYKDIKAVSNLGMRAPLTKYAADASTQRIYGTCIVNDVLRLPTLSIASVQNLEKYVQAFRPCTEAEVATYPPPRPGADNIPLPDAPHPQ